MSQLLLLIVLFLATASCSNSRRRLPSDVITTAAVPIIDIALLAEAFLEETLWSSSTAVASDTEEQRAVQRVIEEIDAALQEYGA